VVIVGGGISGLAAAVQLANAGRPLRLTLIEAADRMGGCIATEQHDGFTIEHGPDAVLAAKPATVDVARRVGIADRLIGLRTHGSFVLSRGRLVRLPYRMSGLVPSRLSALLATRLLSAPAKARIALELLVRPRAGGGEESIADFVVRRFGREMYERVAEPLLTGVFAGDGAQLSLDATFPRLRALERQHGSVWRGILTERRSATRDNRGAALSADGIASPLLSFDSGMAELPEAAARWLAGKSHGSLEIDIRLRSPAVALLRAVEGGTSARVALVSGEIVHADSIILATPAAVSARLLAPHDAVLGTLLAGIEHASTAAVSLGYSLRHVGRPLNASGYTVPRLEGREAIACTWSSAKFRGRSPDGFALFRVFFGGVRRDAVLAKDDAALVACARAELGETIAIRGEPVIARVTRWPHAIPQYIVGHLRRRAEIEGRMALQPWLALAGNAVHGVGIPDCIRSGERAADRILNWLVARSHARVSTANEPYSARSYVALYSEQQDA